ncbi:MAG: type II toxin-antitoxin system VapC family toxin [Blastomonas sp.]
MTEPLFLLDSNIVIYILLDANCPSARMVQSMQPGSIVTSAIVHAEVMRGIPENEHEARRSAKALFDIVSPLPFGVGEGESYCRIPFKRHRFDRLIAAHALSLGLTLVTANESDFADVPGLRVENWTV